MSDWFNSNNTGSDNQQPIPPRNSVEPPAPIIPPVAPFADSGETNGDQSSSHSGQVSSGAPDEGAVSGWQSTGSTVYPPSGDPQPAPSANGADSWQAAQQENSNPYGGGYPTQGGYDPYSWQPYNTQPPKPPKKKRNPTGVVIGVLGVICAATIVTLSVLLALTVNDSGALLNNSSEETGETQPTSSGGVTTRPVNNLAPSLDISEPTEEGLSTKEIINKNLNSTVVLTMYEEATGYYGYGKNEDRLVKAGEASGIIMSADGYIITNRHCVINEDSQDKHAFARVDVTTYDGTVYEGAEIIGTDQYTDLAVIKVKATNLTPAQFGDSDKLERGDRVVALGNPGGLGWTSTQGIVSGLKRDVYEATGYAIQCIQIDASINPGNSGGPLINSAGQVIAVNSAKIVDEAYEGLGFAIPIKEAMEIINSLTKCGYVKGRVMLGITGQTITLTGYEGFQIKEINEDSVLKGTEAQAGDIITHVNGTRVKSYEEMRLELSKHKVGEQIEMTLLHLENRTGNVKTINIKVTLAEAQS